MNYVYAFLIGLLAANGVPHFVKGITGEPFQTPFKRPSSPVINILWAGANWLVAFGLLSFLSGTHPTAGLLATIGAGGLVMAITLAWRFGSNNR